MPSILPRLKDLVARGDNLPALPSLLLQLHRVLEDPRTGPWQVAEVIERDPGLTVRLLRAANAAAVGGRVALTSVEAAVTRLGMLQVRNICVVHAVADAFGVHRGRLEARDFWAHAATVAALTSNLWARVGDRRVLSVDDAYVVGLLHDVGLLVLDRHFPDEFEALVEARHASEEPLATLEEEIFGLDHGTVASLLLGRWALPAAVAEAICHHNLPDAAPGEVRTLATVLAAAEGMCWQMDLGLAIEGRPVELPALLLRSLGVPAADVRRIIETTLDVHAFADGFLAPVMPSAAA